MRTLCLALLAATLGCSARPMHFQVTEEDTYAVYRAILQHRVDRTLGVTYEVHPLRYTSDVWESPMLASIDGFNPGALSAFHSRPTDPGTPLDVTRLASPSTAGNAARGIGFARVAFDPTGTYAVTVVSVADAGETMLALTRTVDGRWAVVAQRMLSVY